MGITVHIVDGGRDISGTSDKTTFETFSKQTGSVGSDEVFINIGLMCNGTQQVIDDIKRLAGKRTISHIIITSHGMPGIALLGLGDARSINDKREAQLTVEAESAGYIGFSQARTKHQTE
jgi:hypothetical protein